MQLFEYRNDTSLDEYPADVIVKNVPVDCFDNDADCLDYYEKHKNNPVWKKRNKEILDNFNPVMMGEIFYCLKCGRMEDGAHRRIIAQKKGIKYIDVRTGGDCYKNYVKAGRLLRSDSTFIETLSKLIDENPKRHRLDKKWMLVSAADKWPFILQHVDFRNKSLFDLGCNIGYSCLRAWSLMAAETIGIDIRQDVLDVALKMRKMLGADGNDLYFSDDGMVQHLTHRRIDIVMSMGVLHYILKKNYEKIFNQLCNLFSPNTLILELRIKKNRKDIALETCSGNQTAPTEGWLYRKLENNGFFVKAIYNREKDRALWIAERR